MKRILTSWLLLVIFAAIVSSCKKEDTGNNGGGTFEAIDYTFNKATQSFEPVEEVTANIIAPGGIRFVYCFLIRDDQTDSLIYVSNNSGENPKNYTLSIPIESFPELNMSKVKGVKILVKQADNSSIQGFINMNFFDPDLPQLVDFPAEITADLNGGTTSITGNLSSIYGLKQVDIYDDYQTENTYVLVNSFTNINNAKEYAFSYAYSYRKAAQHIKIVATDIYNQTNEVIIDMPVDMSLFKPRMLDFPNKITDGVVFTGKITSVTGLKKIDIYDDKSGSYELLTTKDNLSASLDYNFSYTYTLRKRASNIKIVAVDLEDVQSELIIPIDVEYGTILYRNVEMNAQTVGTQNVFYDATGTALGSCTLPAQEAAMAFLFHGVTAGPSFYSPTNTSGIAANVRCNSVGWVIGNSNNLRATRFRTLLPSVTGVNNIYSIVNSGNLDKLDDAFLTGNSIALMGAGGGSTSRFDPTVTLTSTVTGTFNATDVNMILVKIPDTGGAAGAPSVTYKNALIHVKEATFNTTVGNSTIKFDIYIQK